MTFSLHDSARVAAGLVAGLLGGFATRLVAGSFEFLPPGTGDVAFWAVVVGGTYKGWAAAKKRRAQIEVSRPSR